MSILLKLVCYDCKVGVVVGSSNTRIVEEPRKVGRFLWKHKDHNIGLISDSGEFQDSFLYGFPEEDLEDE